MSDCIDCGPVAAHAPVFDVTGDVLPWNRNIHFHRLILRGLDPMQGCVLDVGCGDGQLSRRLAEGSPRLVVGIDRYAPGIRLARSLGGGVSYILGDLQGLELESASWDGIVSVDALHHMELRSTLEQVRRLLKPGGVFVAVGLARSRLRDRLWDAAGLLLGPALARGRVPAESGSLAGRPPAHDYGEVRAIARQVLPGVVYRRHLLFRYSLRWTKPRDG